MRVGSQTDTSRQIKGFGGHTTGERPDILVLAGNEDRCSPNELQLPSRNLSIVYIMRYKALRHQLEFVCVFHEPVHKDLGVDLGLPPGVLGQQAATQQDV